MSLINLMLQSNTRVIGNEPRSTKTTPDTTLPLSTSSQQDFESRARFNTHRPPPTRWIFSSLRNGARTGDTPVTSPQPLGSRGHEFHEERNRSFYS
ncbi:hypothetical protein TNCV_163511 [Trichonephila clavipes]|nr:hypothetical protein TNCV_163511 [Trichonephila clavipes]